MSANTFLFQIAVIISMSFCNVMNAQNELPFGTNEPHRPQIHFSPREHWMNDPNGMVYYKGSYHLFYQYYPGSTVWGPMHWGHATSKDLIHWDHQPIALYPDSLGYIFSGSVVVDYNNTSGFAKNGIVPLVAIFTHHDPVADKEGKNTYQNQSIAYSLDEGQTWTKYAMNPVLHNPGVRDFRDPKVSWHAATKRWIMTLATSDCITFYSSPDLKNWTKESEFGKEIGAHGGVWECPDLFSIDYQGKKLWVLIVNLNPGGPNGGSATQYFIGNFNGRRFSAFDSETRWVDYGPDEYAGVTYTNTDKRRIFQGWMSNWQYATRVPTENWRNAATIPRELSIRRIAGKYFLSSKPVKELNRFTYADMKMKGVIASNLDLGTKSAKLRGPVKLKLNFEKVSDFTITLSNTINQKLVIGFSQSKNGFFIDRTQSGKSDFEQGFARTHNAPRFVRSAKMDITLIIDDASVELFADNGLTVMTSIFFPHENYSSVRIDSPDSIMIDELTFSKLRSILSENPMKLSKN